MSTTLDLENIIRGLVDRSVHMSLATVSGNKPWVSEVHFAYDDDLNLYWISTPDRRHSQELTSNPNVAGNIVQQCAPGEPCGGAAYFEGTAEVVEDSGQLEAIAPMYVDRIGWPKSVEALLEDAVKPDGKRVYKVSVSRWAAFGDFEGTGMQKHELDWPGVN